MTTRPPKGNGASPIASGGEQILFRLYAVGGASRGRGSTARQDVHPRTLPWALLPTLAKHPGSPSGHPQHLSSLRPRKPRAAPSNTHPSTAAPRPAG